MRPLLALCAVVAASISLTGAAPALVSRAAMAAVEKNFDRRLEGMAVDTPLMLLGMTRGVYLDGYGAVFTAEVNLAPGPVPSPFRPAISKEEIARIRQKKLERLPALKGLMRDMLVAAAGSLDTVPADERLVVGILLFHFSWEDSSGLPAQIVMQAPRRVLLEFQTGRRDRAALESALQVREF
jgi:hypothetical protein